LNSGEVEVVEVDELERKKVEEVEG